MSHAPAMNGRFETADVKAAARGRAVELLTSLGGLPAEVLDGRHHGCPKCGGDDRFRLVDRDDGAVICGQCFSQRNGDWIAALQWLNGWSFPQTLRAAAEFLGMAPTSQASGPVDVMSVVARQKRVTVEGFKAYGAAVRNGAVVLPTFDAAGHSLAEFSIAPGSGKGLFPKNGTAGVFVPVVNGKARIPQPGETWYVVEGVKDAAALWALGFLAVGLPTCKMNQKFAAMFRGVNVVFVPDRDKAGDDGARQAAAKLYRLAASIRIAILPAEFKDKGGADVRDILAKTGGEQLLREALAAALDWEPPRTNGYPQDEMLKPGAVEGLPDVTCAEGQTDVANGLRLRLRFGDRFRWVDPWQKFLVWDGRRWAIDKQLAVDVLAREVHQSLWEEFGPKAGGLSREELTRCSSFIRNSGSARGIRSMIERVRSEDGIPILPEQLDQHPHLLNVENGTLDLQSMKLRAHSRGDWLTKLCPVVYDPAAVAPTWSAFVERIFAGDAELIDFIQRSVGYSLCADVGEHALFFCHGLGSNGKSTFLNLLMQLLGGDYSCKASSDLLLLSGRNSHPTGLTDLAGKRLVCCIEADEGKRLAESMVKEMTGGDAIRARRMKEDFWQFQPTHKIWLAANHKPAIHGTDDGIWRRIKLIPFAVTFDDASKDRSMPAKLAAELPGVLNWALAGYRRWREFGLETPQIVRDAVSKYRASMDMLGQFIDECCIISSGVKIKSQQLFNAYRSWVGDGGLNLMRFGNAIVEKGFEKTKSNGVWYLGIALRDSDHNTDEEQYR